MKSHGMAEGLRVWYGADFNKANETLASDATDPKSLAEKGLALREMLSLMIAQRRPSHYLTKGHDELAELTDSHIRLLAQNGVIDAPLCRRGPGQQSHVSRLGDPTDHSTDRNQQGHQRGPQPPGRVAQSSAVRPRSARPLCHQHPARRAANPGHRLPESLADPAYAAEVGLMGERLLTPTSTTQVRYSFTLFELTPDGSRVRVQTDSTDQPFDINEGSKLELGSTAKMRVLTTLPADHCRVA